MVDKRSDQPDQMFNIYSCGEKTTPWNVVVNINNKPVKMQVDTGGCPLNNGRDSVERMFAKPGTYPFASKVMLICR